jgi:hypothetical protein
MAGELVTVFHLLLDPEHELLGFNLTLSMSTPPILVAVL